MRVSTIIPIYNEAAAIEKVQRSIRPLAEKSEIIFVDGGSTDGTRDLIRPEFTVISSHKGRANQMNRGAEISHGGVLFFLHCDSEVPATAMEEICRVMENYQAGCFGIRFPSDNLWMRCCQVLSNFRVKSRGIMFGDQGIFLDRRLFFELGGFPDLPIMEDYQFSLDLREKRVKVGMTRSRILTSDRRFVQGGPLRVMWKMNRLRAMYRRGVDIQKIAALYRDIR